MPDLLKRSGCEGTWSEWPTGEMPRWQPYSSALLATLRLEDSKCLIREQRGVTNELELGLGQ